MCTLKRFLILLTLPLVVISSENKRPRVDDEFIKNFRKLKISEGTKIDTDQVAPFLGHGGSYESVQPIVSKLNTIESDHAPHYSILDYVDTKNTKDLPDNIRRLVEERKILQDDLGKTEYPDNQKKLTRLKAELSKAEAELKKSIRVNNWPQPLKKMYYSNKDQISKLIKENLKEEEKSKKNPDDPSSKSRIKENNEKVTELREMNSKLRGKAEKLGGKSATEQNLLNLEKEHIELEKKNRDLSKQLDNHNMNIKKAMGVLSIPYDKHRIFPSTGNAGLDKDIKELKTANDETAKRVMEEYGDAWKTNMQEGIKQSYLTGADDFLIKDANGKFIYGPDGRKQYDFSKMEREAYQRIWEQNFDSIIETVQGNKGTNTKTKYMTRLYGTYAKKFMTTAIYYVKTPNGGYSRLVNLYIAEYKIYLKNDFDSYKGGLQKLLQSNKDFGWLTPKDVEKLENDHKLKQIVIDTSSTDGAKRVNQWNKVDEYIKIKSDKSKNPITPAKPRAVSSGAGTVCSSSTRRKRSAGSMSGCIFYSRKPHDINIDLENEDNPKAKTKGNSNDGLPRPKTNLPSDADTVSIDSKKLNNYLSQLHDTDIESVMRKKSIVEYAARNTKKLSGAPEDIAKTKALLKHENLDGHSKQNDLASNVNRNSFGDNNISPKALSKYQKVKASASRFAAKTQKFTKGSNKVSNSYGKIMLGKSVVTALRHGDYESLALIGGRIGLEFALDGVTKLGTHIAKKATTKFMTKFGSQFLGKMAGPVGAIADIGIGAYSITKSVKILNHPNASRYDQNDAIADIVADTVDIGVTATAAVLSLVFPPLAPLFAAVAFVVNVLSTFGVAFYKAANHVDRINNEIPLLDFERKTEYLRFVEGRNTSGYIQDLIDTKKANNIAVDMTVQFLKDNDDYIGRIFPSKTMYDPEAQCNLQKKICSKFVHFIKLGCSPWKHVSSCDGHGGYCKKGKRKCQSNSGTGVVIPLGGHDELEYRCQCGPDPAPEWGYDILDNEVDFRRKQNVYLQRAAPDKFLPPNFSYRCKPSSLSNEGHRVSNPHTDFEYLCKGAIGIEKNTKVGKFMLYDLQTGTDTVRCNENELIDNLFVVQDGLKQFYGNAGDDTFVFDGPCDSLSGIFDGAWYKQHGNSIVLGKNCSPSRSVEVDLVRGKVEFGQSSASLYNIQRVFGRKNGTDVIKVDCTTKLVVPGGGSGEHAPDVIIVPACYASFELIVSVDSGSTRLDASGFSGGTVNTFLEGQIDFTAIVPSVVSGTLLFKFGNVTSLKAATVEGGSGFTLQFSNGGKSSIKFTKPINQVDFPDSCEKSSINEAQIVITENSNFSRQLAYNLEIGTVQAVYRLEESANPKSISGYDFIDNVFHLMSGSWNVYGGQLNNQFILSSSQFSGSIDGRSGQNSLQIASGFNKVGSLEIDLKLGNIQIARHKTIRISNVQSLIGFPELSERVTATCKTKYISLGGASQDYVEIPALNCPMNLTLAVKGKVTVVDRKTNGTVVIQAGYEKLGSCANSTTPQQMELSMDNLGGGQMTLLLNFEIFKLESISVNELIIVGGHQIKINGKFPNIYFEEEYNLQSTLVVENKEIIAFHELNVEGTKSKVRKGANIIRNFFKLVSGTNWKVFGGNKANTFLLTNDKFEGVIDGGKSGKNSLHISDEIRVGDDVDITQNEVQIRGSKSIAFENIKEFHGRKGQPERISVGCGTQYVGMNGGNYQNYDQVIIPKLTGCNPKMTIVSMGYTELISTTDKGIFDIYLQPDSSENLKFKSNIMVTNLTNFNIPIQIPAYKLNSYELKITEGSSRDFKVIQMRLNLSSNNFVELYYKFVDGGVIQNVNPMFVDEDFNSNGNILVNMDSLEINVLHVLQHENGAKVKKRSGAVGAKNIFRLHTGNWEAFGGPLDDSFILNEGNFKGTIHGLRGTNSLILVEDVAGPITVDLKKGTLTMGLLSNVISINSIQIVGGRKEIQDKVICGCDTKLIMLEGGLKIGQEDEIVILEDLCHPQTSFVVPAFTEIKNDALKGNFTYHIRTHKNFDIKYTQNSGVNHAFKFEIPLEQVRSMNLNQTVLSINFVDGVIKDFPLNFENLPTFHIGEGPELFAELILIEDKTPQTSTIARSPFSGNIKGLNGAENGIIIQTENKIESIIGGDKDDNIFLSQVQSVSLIDGGEGVNRLEISEGLYEEEQFEVDLNSGVIYFLEDFTPFVNDLKGISLFKGRESGFERVILGCDTASVKFADQVVIRRNCVYNVRIEVEPSTRVMFEIDVTHDEDYDETDEEHLQTDDVESTTESLDDIEDGDDDNANNFEDDEESDDFYEMLEILEPSTFYYHFSSAHSFDIEVDTFKILENTRHIFYLNFTLSDLKSLRFSREDSRLIYSTLADDGLEFSHLVAEVDEFSMFYSQPEFMTSEGFLLRVTRYGEIIAVVANPDETVDLKLVQNDLIPRLSTYASSLHISFMLETKSDFIYCGTPTEINLLTNRDNLRSHLVGFNETTYEILDLDNDVFIYPQNMKNDSVHVLDLSDIVSQIRNQTRHKYIPSVTQMGTNLEIRMTNWTDVYRSKVILVNGTHYVSNLVILLNSIAMEILPEEKIMSVSNNNRIKRSVGDDQYFSWSIKPRPISIPEGHVFSLSAEDLEDHVEIIKGGGDKDSKFTYSINEKDLIITSVNEEEVETERSTAFVIFEYYSASRTFNKVETVNDIHIKLDNKSVKVSSNAPLMYEETGKKVDIQFYEDILDNTEKIILKDFPDIPRKFKVPWLRKIMRKALYKYAALGFIFFTCAGILGALIYILWWTESKKRKYNVEKELAVSNGNCHRTKKSLIKLDNDFKEKPEPVLMSKSSLNGNM